MRLQLHGFFHGQIAIFNPEMRGRKFRPDNSTGGVRTFIKTPFAKSHPENLFLTATVHTLVANVLQFQHFAQQLIHAEQMLRQVQKILDWLSVLGNHFLQSAGKFHREIFG